MLIVLRLCASFFVKREVITLCITYYPDATLHLAQDAKAPVLSVFTMSFFSTDIFDEKIFVTSIFAI